MGRVCSLVIAMALLAAPAHAATSESSGGSTPLAVAANDLPPAEAQFSEDQLCVVSDREHGWRPCRGRSRDALSYQDFYRLAQRPDLAEADDARWYRRQLRFAAGAVAIVAGLVTFAPRLAGKSIVPWWASAAIVGGGVGLVVWGAQTSQEPLVGPEDAGEMADSYNRGLRRRLGLPPPGGGRLAIGVTYQRSF